MCGRFTFLLSLQYNKQTRGKEFCRGFFLNLVNLRSQQGIKGLGFSVETACEKINKWRRSFMFTWWLSNGNERRKLSADKNMHVRPWDLGLCIIVIYNHKIKPLLLVSTTPYFYQTFIILALKYNAVKMTYSKNEIHMIAWLNDHTSRLFFLLYKR